MATIKRIVIETEEGEDWVIDAEKIFQIRNIDDETVKGISTTIIEYLGSSQHPAWYKIYRYDESDNEDS